MVVEEVVGRLKVHEDRFRSYEDKEEEKYLLLTHEMWLARTKKNDTTYSFLSGMRGCGSHNKENKGVDVVADMAVDVVTEEAMTIPHKPMTMPTPRRKKV